MNIKMQIVSDIHLEFFSNKTEIKYFTEKLINNDNEILILAGDIGTLKNKGKEHLIYFFELIKEKYKHIIYVLGNHEYYNYVFNNLENDIKNLLKEYSNIYVLENDCVVLENIVFYGTTLWFKETLDTILNSSILNDFKYIYNFNPYLANKEAVNYLQNIEELNKFGTSPGLRIRTSLRSVLNLKQVLITHHLPSNYCVNQRFKDSKMNCYFVCDIEKYLYLFDNVIFGHTHNSNDFYINKTRLISNPYGYYGENNKFLYNKVVEIN